MSCDLDPINMVCWTHGVDISERDYIEGVCCDGYYEREEEESSDDFDEDFYYPDESPPTQSTQ